MVEGVLAAAEELAGVAMAVRGGVVSGRVAFGEDVEGYWGRRGLGRNGGFSIGRTVPENVALGVDLGGPFHLAAVAFSLVGRHDCWIGLVMLYFCFLCCERWIDFLFRRPWYMESCK